MMNIQKKSLLTILFAGAVATVPVLAQDVQSGLKDLESERFAKAEQTFKQLASSAPTADNQFYLGYTYLRENQFDQAKATFEKGLAADPKNQLNNVGLGAVALAKKDRATGQTLINNAVKESKSKDQNVLFRAGEAYTMFETNDPAEAVRLLDLAMKLDKKNSNPEIRMAMGDAYMIKNDGGNAVSKYEDALLISPNLAEANYKTGKIYLRGKNYKLAQEFYQKAIANDPEFAPTYRDLAEALFGSRAYKPAAKNMDLYIQKSGTTDPDMILRSAQFDFLAQDYLKANSKLDLIKDKVKNPVINRIYGWSYAGLGKNQEAVETLTNFINTAPDKVIGDDYKYRGRAYGSLGTPEGDSLAIVDLEKAAPTDTTENLYRELAKKTYDMKKYDKAATYYAKAISTDKKPLNTDYLFEGLSNYQQGFRVGRDVAQGDTAMQRQLKQQYFLRADSAFANMIQRVEQAGDTYPVAYYYRGQSNYYAYPSAVALNNGAAVPYYEKFIQQATTEPDAAKKQTYQKYLVPTYKLLASYSLAKKDETKAKEYIAKVREIDPNDKDAKAFLEGPKATPGAKTDSKTTVKKASTSK